MIPTHKLTYIILNGPPESGKSTIARELCRELAVNGMEHSNAVSQDSLTAPMKHFVATALGEKYLEANKDRSRPELNGRSIRDFMNDLSEYMRTNYGEDIFGRWLTHRSLRDPRKRPIYYLVDDGGLWPELNAIPNKLIVRIERPGKSFRGDVRGYVEPAFYTLRNFGGLIDLFVEVKKLASTIKEHCHGTPNLP